MEHKTVLLVEDDPAHVELTRRALQQVQFSCRLEVVGDGTEMIEFLFATGGHAGRDSTQTPDLVLLDLKMPEMDGLQVLQVLRRVRSDDLPQLLPVVIFATSSTEDDVFDAYRLGAQSFVHKPVEFQQFVETVRRIVSYWLQLNEPVPTRRAGLLGNSVRPAAAELLDEEHA